MKITAFKKVILCLIFFLTGIMAIAQAPKDTLVAFNYFKKADSLLLNKNYKKSIILFNKALPIYEKAASWERVANCYNKVSEIFWRSYELEESLLHTKKALNICNNHLTKDHLEEAKSYDNIGEYHRRKGVYKNVLQYYQKALKIREKILPEFHVSIAKSYANIGLYYQYISKNNQAIIYYKKALAIYQKKNGLETQNISGIYNNLGNVYDALQKYDFALNCYKKALTITIKNKGKNHLYASFGYLNIGDTYRNLKQLKLALEYTEKALFILKKEEHSYGLSIVYQNIGVNYYDKGELDKALQYYKKSLKLKQKLHGDNHPEVAVIYVNIGIIIQNYNLNKSLTYFNKALHIYKEVFGENHFGIADIYESLGINFLLKKEYETALTYHHKSLEIRKKILNKNHTNMARSYYNLGLLHNEKSNYISALEYYKKSLSILKKSKKNSELVPDGYTGIGTMYYKQHDYKNALAYYDKALTYNTKKNSKTVTNVFNPENYHFLDKLFETLLEKSKTLQELYKKDQITKDLSQSIKSYQNLDLLVNHFRKSFQNYEDKVDLAEQAKEIYSHAIVSHLLNYNATSNQTDLEKAFYYAEKSKSNILKDLLMDTHAKNFSKLPQEIITLESTLKSNRAFYQSQIVTQQSKDSIDVAYVEEYENKLFNASRRQDSLVRVLEKEYPKYYQLKHSKKLISIKETQNKINAKTTVLEFFVTDSIIYTFAISKNAISIKELQVTELTQKIQGLNKAVTSENNAEYKKTAHILYQELLLPVKDKIVGNELIIIPDGSLWHLNFDLLLTQKSATQNTRDLPYLLRDYAISYANSAHLLFNSIKDEVKSSEKREECLAFSFSDTTNAVAAKTMSLATLRNAGDDLPGTRKEIRAISEIFNGHYYYGADAKEANFKEKADRYKIIHLALHAEVDHKNPQNSKLYFSKGKDSIEDNLLHAHELFALNIPAELTVLSACNTGIGKIANGEGIMSLGNAFQYAGTKSLLLSSWEVSDKTTPTLMTYFYANLKEGMNKAKALQQAKLKYLNTTEAFYTNPFYWGSFYILGDTSPITINNDFNSIYVWFGLGILICLLVFFIKNKRVTN